MTTRSSDKVLVKFTLKINGKKYALMETRYGNPNFGVQCQLCDARAAIATRNMSLCFSLGDGCAINNKPFPGRMKYFLEIVK